MIVSRLLKPIKEKSKQFARATLPISFRKSVCLWLNEQNWLDADLRYWWTKELLKDFSEQNASEYHRFLWRNHLAYALTYEVAERFGPKNMPGSRRIFFSDLERHLSSLGIDAEKDIQSVFEGGCSLGYQLRWLETDMFSSANILEGIDIDDYAIQAGKAFLGNIGSKIRLTCDDMLNLDLALHRKEYDITICTGVLMYMKQKEASRVVESMLKHCRIVAAFSGPAHPSFDNSSLEQSVVREMDGSLIHNIDAMIEKAGGRVFARRWEGDHFVDGHSIYFVFASKL